MTTMNLSLEQVQEEAPKVAAKRAQEMKADGHEYRYRVVIKYKVGPPYAIITASEGECHDIANRRNETMKGKDDFVEAYVEKQKVTYGPWKKWNGR